MFHFQLPQIQLWPDAMGIALMSFIETAAERPFMGR